MKQFFPETKIWVQDPFLAFYKRYGLDICGYPITDEFERQGLRMQYFQRVALEEFEPGQIRLRLAAQHALEAEKRINDLEAEIKRLQERLETGRGAAPQPTIIDIIEGLPRDPDGMFTRPLADVRYIVINHTAVRPGVAISRIAEAHRRRWPAIVCQFYIEGDGAIYQTNPLVEVVDNKEPWLRDAINIHLAGDFSDGIPTSEQMDSLAGLCAWLLDTTSLENDAIRGASEFGGTQSPGQQWMTGANWKEMLLRQINVLRSGHPAQPDEGDSQQLREQLAELRSQRDGLATQLTEARAQIESLIQQIVDLEKTIRQGGRGAIEAPPIDDYISKLPRDDDKMIERPLDQIQFIVINHTAVPPDVAVKRVAKAHRVRWPAIICQYYVNGDGTILQTNPVDQVVDDSQTWLWNGVNIHVAGNFSDEIPGEEQLASLSALIAWLLTTYDLPIESVKGVQEFIVTQSPGRQWLHGAHWKDILLGRVRSLLQTGVDSGDNEALLTALRAQIQQLQTDKQQLAEQIDQLQKMQADLEHERTRLRETIAKQKSLIEQLQSDSPDKTENPPAIVVAKPSMVELVDQLPKHPVNRYAQRSLNQITHIAIHHSAAPANVSPQRIAEYHVNSLSHQWPGMGYHYYIGPDGTIYHTQDLALVAYHVFRNNSYSVGVCVAGNFTNVLPTPAQIVSAGNLVAWLMQEFNVTLDRVQGHKEFPYNITSCPGRQWLSEGKWKDHLVSRIQAVRQGQLDGKDKTIYHYVLFWQHPNQWAQEDWLGAVNYIGRFRPTAGFSLDDALTAQRVTIIGGVAGVSQQAENILRTHGCVVERIAGKDFAETKAMLNRMAESGQRFLRP